MITATNERTRKKTNTKKQSAPNNKTRHSKQKETMKTAPKWKKTTNT